MRQLRLLQEWGSGGGGESGGECGGDCVSNGGGGGGDATDFSKQKYTKKKTISELLIIWVSSYVTSFRGRRKHCSPEYILDIHKKEKKNKNVHLFYAFDPH